MVHVAHASLQMRYLIAHNSQISLKMQGPRKCQGGLLQNHKHT
uniref:Uncharacterized protein n=1 Tax=Anguilla anguilla TaxID=7936 RepID=A0A0E9QT85_ANGAN